MQGGSRIQALDGIFESTMCPRPRLDISRRVNELEEGQQGTAGAATTIVHTFIFSLAHLLMLESTPYLLKAATWTDDLTLLLSTTAYCWKAVEMSAQQVGVLSTKFETIQAWRNASLSEGNNMFVRLGTDYDIRNGGYFESIKNSANQFIPKP